MASYEVKQGNSFWLDYTMKIKPATKTIADIGTWTDFNAVWEIGDGNGVAILSGACTRSTSGIFTLRIGPATTVVGQNGVTGDAAWWLANAPLATPGWSALPVGTYPLTIQITNIQPAVDFCLEDSDDELVILTQVI